MASGGPPGSGICLAVAVAPIVELSAPVTTGMIIIGKVAEVVTRAMT